MEIDVCPPLTLPTCPAAQPAPDTALRLCATWGGLGYCETGGLHVSLNHTEFLGHLLLSTHEQQ